MFKNNFSAQRQITKQKAKQQKTNKCRNVFLSNKKIFKKEASIINNLFKYLRYYCNLLCAHCAQQPKVY